VDPVYCFLTYGNAQNSKMIGGPYSTCVVIVFRIHRTDIELVSFLSMCFCAVGIVVPQLPNALNRVAPNGENRGTAAAAAMSICVASSLPLANRPPVEGPYVVGWADSVSIATEDSEDLAQRRVATSSGCRRIS